MATTKPIPQPQFDQRMDLAARVLAANTLVPFGTIAVNDVNGVKPFTDTLFQAGAPLAGAALGTYENTTAAPVNQRMLFARKTPVVLPKAKVGDVPVEAQVGLEISLADNETVKATKAANDVGVTLLEILPGGAGYRVALP